MTRPEESVSNPARRSALKSGLVTAGIAAAGSAALQPETAEADDWVSPRVAAFVQPLPVYGPMEPRAYDDMDPKPTKDPGIDEHECGRLPHQAWDMYPPVKFYEIDVEERDHEFHPSLPKQPIWGYDGIMPGPTIVARYGEPVVVRICNKLPRADQHTGFGSPEISTHLHNLHAPSESDGYTADWYSKEKCGLTALNPGEWRDHHYPNMKAGNDPAEALGTLWFHDHREDHTAANVYRGLAGFYLLFDDLDCNDETKGLRLPSGVGKYDIPLMFTDRQFDSGGYMRLDPFETDGILGDRYLVNGKIQPYFEVQRRRYRFRLLNASPSRIYEFYLQCVLPNKTTFTYQNFTYIANDGNLLPGPLVMNKIRMGPAERADIIIDFALYPPGTKLYIANRLEMKDGRGPEDQLLATGIRILEFRVGEAPPADQPDMSLMPVAQVAGGPPTLRPMPVVNTASAVTSRRFRFDRLNGFWTVNSKIFDPLMPVAQPKKGTAEIWTLEVNGNWWHPVHIHMEEFVILSRNGKAPPAHERGRKDVVLIRPGEVVRIFIRFRDFTGKYMMHCHNLTHEDHAMMVRFDVI